MTGRLWDVPPSWCWTAVKEIGEVISGGTPSTKEPDLWGGDVIWFAPSDLTGYKQKYIARGAKTLTQRGLSRSSARVMPAGSVMFSSRAPVGYVAINTVPAATNQGFKSLVPHAGIVSEFLFYFFKAIRHIAEERATGTTFKELSGSAFAALPVPVPPTNEQRRIVERIEALFDEIDRGVDSLRKARATLGLYRQSLLKSAFDGRLTADWRARNADKLEPPAALLSRIRNERDTRYKAALDTWQTALTEWRAAGEKGRKPAKPKRPRDIPAKPIDIGIPGWTVVPLGLLIDDPTYGTSKKCDYNGGSTGVLRIPNVRAGQIDAGDLKSTDFDEVEMEQYQLLEGDVLTVRSNGSLSIVGKPALVRAPDTNFLFAGYLIRLRPIPGSLIPRNLVYLMLEPSIRGQIEGKAKSTSGVNNISAKELQELLVPICSPAEQAEMVRILDARIEAADMLEAEIDAALTRAEALRQSILKQAFSGRLVPQDPTDEPATALLERIRAERANASAAPRRRARA